MLEIAGESERERERAKNDSQLMSRRWAGELRRAKSGCDALLYFSPTSSSSLSPAAVFLSIRPVRLVRLCVSPSRELLPVEEVEEDDDEE